MRKQGTYNPDPLMTIISSNESYNMWKGLIKNFQYFSGRSSERDEDTGNKNHL